jgi:hypothetical protein
MYETIGIGGGEEAMAGHGGVVPDLLRSSIAGLLATSRSTTSSTGGRIHGALRSVCADIPARG